MRRFASLVSVLWLLSPFALAGVSLPVLLSDGVVLQRERPIHVWGKAAPGETVQVAFLKQSKSTTADFAGRWHIYLSPEAAGGPYELTVAGANKIVLHDVLVGDVWVASGQSNMEYPMEGWGGTAPTQAQEIPKANLPSVHLLHVEHAYSDHPLNDLGSAVKWESCTPETVRQFSAVAYYFAKEITAHEKVPIGVIETSWGGTPAEAWTSLDGLSSNANLMPVFAARAEMSDSQIASALNEVHEDQLKAEAKAKGLPEPQFDWHPDPHSWAPTELYNAMLAPLTLLPIRGVIWYQGESNSGEARAQNYEELFETMIRDWRAHWGIGNFPFLFVQISAFSPGPGERWAFVREAQRKTLSLANTGMAVTIDIGNRDDVHPTDKLDVGLRLSLAARALTYGERIEFSGPAFRQITREQHGLRIWFDHAHTLKPAAKGWCGFEVAGEDGKYAPAETKMDGSTIVVSNATIDTPQSVRYAWENYPECPFFNEANLPASPFRASLPLFH